MKSSKSRPLAPSEVQKTEDLLSEYLERKAQPPSREVQEKRARLLNKLSELNASASTNG